MLFLLQPMISKIILPDFGGGSSIWLTSLIFYQLLLLGGYAFSHFVVQKFRPAKQAFTYTAIILLSLLFIPVQIHFRQADLMPVFHIFLLLLTSIGLPYFLLSTTSPMVQYWIAAEDKKRNPYILYAVSNGGSLAGLLAYPIFIEPYLTNSQQTAFLSYGFGFYAFLILLCLILYLKKRRGGGNTPQAEPPAPGNTKKEVISWQRRLGWMGQSMVPAAALLVFTQYLTVDIVNFPLLWVIPLSLYLISFVVCFLWPGISKPGGVRTVLVILPVMAVTLSLRAEFGIPFAWRIAAACIGLFAICMFFHGNLERTKPAPANLTYFYLYLSLGACLGSFLVGVAAPLVFKSTVELFIVIIISFYLILLPFFKERKKSLRVFFQVTAALLLVISFINEEILFHHYITYRTRSFYGAYSIRTLPEIPGKHIAAKILSHGTTIHGGQARDSHNNLTPISYFHRNSGVGLAFDRLPRVKNIGVVGLGTGMLSLYGKAGDTFDFFEIDAAVVDIARNRFDNLRSSPARIRHFIGDARIEIGKIAAGSYDMLVLDAFSSGAIPTHLLTIEAMREYLRVLRKDGVILFHISNRYVNLLPVLNCAARELGLFIKYHQCLADKLTHRISARWVIAAKNKTLFDTVTSENPDWMTLPEKTVCWSDEFSNLWALISF
ncbi:MAG: class I SAM-dependent methyltransferase [Candidatus Aminicenantes bacterium]|nr:class I SAM-dependent methyltransferase [Candidatus Aminicenantes bacterium]